MRVGLTNAEKLVSRVATYAQRGRCFARRRGAAWITIFAHCNRLIYNVKFMHARCRSEIGANDAVIDLLQWRNLRTNLSTDVTGVQECHLKKKDLRHYFTVLYQESDAMTTRRAERCASLRKH